MNDRKQSDILVIMWSGGYDSTAVLLQSLSSSYTDIRVITVELKNANAENMRMDLEARDKIIELLKVREPRFDSRYKFYNSVLDIYSCGGTQAMAWAGASSIRNRSRRQLRPSDGIHSWRRFLALPTSLRGSGEIALCH
jgi:7-cyano-7-deazaguanine synthase in queuosine biosynthesis